MAYIPTGSSIAGSLYVADYRAAYVTSGQASSGTMTATFDPVDPGNDYAWLVTNVSVSSTSSSTTEARVYVGEPNTVNLVAGTSSGNLDFDDVAGDGLLVPASLSMCVMWTGASDGAVGVVRIQYQVIRQSS